jgi:hypothetical protein
MSSLVLSSRTCLIDPESHKEYPLPSPSLSMLPFAIVHPRKSVHRTIFALFSLIALSLYIFCVAKPTFALSTPFALRRTVYNVSLRPPPLPKHRKTHITNIVGPALQLNQSQELAAVTSFLASLPQNVIPFSVDPARAIDPQLVLDFDTRSQRASQELQVMVDDVWARNPVVLYSKFYSPVSREIKSLLSGMNLRPEPTIFDVDLRDDALVLTPLLRRLTDSQDLPILLVGGKSIGSLQQIRTLQESGELQQMVTTAGAVVNGAKKRKGRK